MAAGKRTKRGRQPIPLEKSDLPRVLKAAAEAAHEYWRKLAQQGLRSSRDTYLAALSPPMALGDKAVIELSGQLADYVENGMPSWDMKQMLDLSTTWATGYYQIFANQYGKGRKWHETGRYRNVPFLHDILGKSGTGTAPALRYGKTHTRRARLSAAKAQKVELSVKSAAKKLRGMGRLHDGMGPKIRGAHVNDPFSGMYRPKMRILGGQARYATFRRMSDHSPAGSWMHPGIHARNYAEQTRRWLEQAAPGIVANVLRI